MTDTYRKLVNWIRQRARRAINQARIQRKYTQKGDYSRVEQAALLALIEIEREIDTAEKDEEEAE